LLERDSQISVLSGDWWVGWLGHGGFRSWWGGWGRVVGQPAWDCIAAPARWAKGPVGGIGSVRLG